MLGLMSTNSAAVPIDIIKTALPIGIGLASAAFITIKMANQYGDNSDKSIPTARIRAGDTTHDAEHNEDVDKFLTRCEEECGPVFNLRILNQHLIAVSGSYAREVLMSPDMSFSDAMDDATGMRSFIESAIKSNKDKDSRLSHEVIRDAITPNLPLFTPRIVGLLQSILQEKVGHCEDKLIEHPMEVIQDMIASAMANVFMGPEIGKERKVVDAFIECTYDFGKVIGESTKSFWHSITNRARYGVFNPLQKHIQVLVDVATPVVLERRRQEAEAVEKGIEYDRPMDILQKLLDNVDKYGFIDMHDICGHILLIVLASVHTTSDSATNLCFYLAAFPEFHEPLYEELQEVLGQFAKEREEERQRKLASGEVASMEAFAGTELDPEHDQDISAPVVKKLVKMDSFVREIFRYRSERLQLVHMARGDMVLSNGMRISKGQKAVINMHSVHQNNSKQVGDEDVSVFYPWRFVGKAKAATKASGDYLAFGMGKHACPGRFLAVQEIKTVGVLMVSRYSKIRIQDPSKQKRILVSRIGDPVPTGLIFTSRTADK
ncbi:hypothetical protein BG011_002262 [Mortierella polycephala]|uniref:Cytochrome P450 n=1 Tax=Mortierella polycephala TaxID=41804 RepID=A0A9P6UAF5_9FUNG|nr:hypothetical protein BG011_002262 [Mortierella polycephala]